MKKMGGSDDCGSRANTMEGRVANRQVYLDGAARGAGKAKIERGRERK